MAEKIERIIHRMHSGMLVKYLAIIAASVGAAIAVTNATDLIQIASQDTAHLAISHGQFLLGGAVYTALPIAMMTLTILLYLRTRKLETERKIEVNGETRFTFALEALKDHNVISETDPAGNILNVNKNWEILFGYNKKDVLGKNVSFLFEDDLHDKGYRILRDAVSNGDVFSGEQKLLSKSGKTVFVQATIIPMFDTDGNHVKTVSMRTDITASRAANSDRFMADLLKGLPEEVYIYDVANYKIIYMNDLALVRSGWTREEAKTKTILEVSNQFDVEGFQVRANQLLEGQEKEVTNQMKLDSGYIEATTRIFQRPDKIPVFISVVRDITAEKLEEERRLQTVAGMSHELRSPLTSIKGSLQLLISGAVGELPPEANRLVGIANRNTDRMLMFLDDILDFEKIVAQKMTIEPIRLNLQEFVHDAIEINKGYADLHEVEFVTGDIPEFACVTGDQNRLAQVITNFMTNAAKFSPPGEKVVVSVSDQGDCWRINVADKGPGIPPDCEEKVFESFTQLEPIDGKARKGTGLGLTIAQKIIELHSGRISFDSVVGAGATFYFELPKTDIEFATAAE